jgi:hypothetical protein
VYEDEFGLLCKVAEDKARNIYADQLVNLEAKINQIAQQQNVMLADLASGWRFLRGSPTFGNVHQVIRNLESIIRDGRPMLIGGLLQGVTLFNQEPEPQSPKKRGRPRGSKNKPKAVFSISKKAMEVASLDTLPKLSDMKKLYSEESVQKDLDDMAKFVAQKRKKNKKTTTTPRRASR